MPEPQVNRSAARYIPVAKPSITAAEKQAVADVMDSGWLSSGPRVEEFEREFAHAHSKRFGVACNSGTSALQLAVMIVGRDKGWFIPTMAMVAIRNAILSIGSPVNFLDSLPSTGNIDPSGPGGPNDGGKKFGFVVQHLYGVPAEFSHSDDYHWIEDCCEAHYAAFADGSPVGSRGGLACFSFFANKIITSGGEGGMVLTNDEATAERLRGLRAHAFTKGEHFHHSEHALGCRMTDLQAAVGLAQHRRRHEMLDRRREIGERYWEALSQLPWVQFQQRTPSSAWWVFPLLVCDGFGLTRDGVRHDLAECGIETRTWFKPLHEQSCHHRGNFNPSGVKFNIATDLYRRGLYLPLHCSMTDSDVDYIIERLASLQS